MSKEPISLEAARIADFISSFGPSKRTIVLRTFEVLLKIPHERQAELLPRISEYIERGTPPKEYELKSFSESPEDIVSFVSAATTLVSFLRGEESIDDIMTGATEALKLAPSVESEVRTFLELLQSQRPQLDRAHQEAILAGATLPSLESAIFSVDLRVRVKDGAVQMHVPVVIAHFDTDVSNERIWFQMSRAQLTELREDLDRVTKKLAVLEKWAENKQ